MAVQKPQGSQLDIQNIAADISADPTAIGDIATGVTSDPGAAATLDADYVRRDGTTALTANLDAGGNAITNVGNVDGRDVSADGAAQDGHLADMSVHFTEASIDHDNIINSGTNNHAAIDAHIGNMAAHFVINDTGPAALNEAYSSQKIEGELALKSDVGHTHVKADITDFSDGDYATAAQGILADNAEPALGYTPANVAGDTFTGDVTVNGTIVGYKDNATSLRMRGPQSVAEGGADVQSYMGIFYNAAYAGTGNLETRAVFGGNIEMDVEIQAPRQLRLSAVDNTQTDGQIWMGSRNNVVVNTRILAEEAAGKQLIIDRVDKATTGTGNTSNVEVSVSSGELEIASPVKFGGIPQLPSYTLGTLPTGVIGGVIYVSDANTGSGAMAFYNGTSWIDSSTGVAVA